MAKKRRLLNQSFRDSPHGKLIANMQRRSFILHFKPVHWNSIFYSDDECLHESNRILNRINRICLQWRIGEASPSSTFFVLL